MIGKWNGFILVLGLLGAVAGCGTDYVGWRYATVCYDGEGPKKIQPRVIVAFYDYYQDAYKPNETQKHWGVAVGAEAAREAITYPGTSYTNWGRFPNSTSWPIHDTPVLPAVCVLADGYWPAIMNANVSPDGRAGLNQEKWAEAESLDREPIPFGCDGVWRVHSIPSTEPYGVAQSHAQGVPPRFLGTIDVALANSKYISPADKEWAYGRLLNLVEAQIAVEQEPARRAVLERWATVFRKHAPK